MIKLTMVLVILTFVADFFIKGEDEQPLMMIDELFRARKYL